MMYEKNNIKIRAKCFSTVTTLLFRKSAKKKKITKTCSSVLFGYLGMYSESNYTCGGTLWKCAEEDDDS